MTWTSSKPTTPGWYWWREPEHNDNTPEICHVYKDEQTGELRVFWTTDCTFADLLTEYDGEWCGPLELPSTARKEGT